MKPIPVMRVVTGAALAIAATLAWSQTPPPAPQPAAAPPAADVPKPNCGELPTDPPGRLSPDSRKRGFERQMRDYGSCIRLYVEERNTAIAAQRKAIQAYVDEYNKTLAAYRTEMEAGKEK